MLLSEGFEVDKVIPRDKDERESLSSDYFRKVLDKEIIGYAVYPGNKIFDAKPENFDSEEFANSIVFYVKKTEK